MNNLEYIRIRDITTPYAESWLKIVGHFKDNTSKEGRFFNRPDYTLIEIIDDIGYDEALRTFSAVAQLKKHDVRIWGKNREFTDSVSVPPELLMWDHANRLCSVHLDDIHTAHIDELITRLRLFNKESRQYRGGLTNDDITLNVVSSDNPHFVNDRELEYSWELWFDVDKYFGTDTGENGKWINFYTYINVDTEEVTSKYSIEGDDEDSTHDWLLTEAEREFLKEKMFDFIKKENNSTSFKDYYEKAS